jgi:hypothetical protein
MDIACPIGIAIRTYDFNNIIGHCLYAIGCLYLVEFDQKGNVFDKCVKDFINVFKEFDLIDEIERKVYFTTFKMVDYYVYNGYQDKEHSTIYTMRRTFGFIENNPVLILEEIENNCQKFRRVLYITNGEERLVERHLVKKHAKDYVKPKFKHIDY